MLFTVDRQTWRLLRFQSEGEQGAVTFEFEACLVGIVEAVCRVAFLFSIFYDPRRLCTQGKEGHRLVVDKCFNS